MAGEKAKSSASGVAALRAAGALERDPLVRNPDYLAVNLLSPRLRVLSRFRPLVWLVIRRVNRILPGGYYFHIARTKHIDAVLQRCAAEGIKQMVIMGAGFDTRAYRFKEILKDVKVFELDYPGTQALKKQRLSRMAKNAPENICYIPIDFNIQKLDILFEHGYSKDLKTLLIWEGVCMYITPESVDEVLSFVKRFSSPGSSIVFDYIFKSMLEGKCDRYGARESSDYAAKLNEPYCFGIEEGAIDAFLKARGFSLISEFTPEMLEQTYLKRKDGKIHGKVYGYTNIVHASV